MNLPDKPTNKQPAPQAQKSKSTVIWWVLLGVVLLGGYLVQLAVRSEMNSIKNNADGNSFISSTDWKPYTSTQDNFTIEFPGFPTIENDTIDVQGYDVPYTTYEKDSGDTFWIVGVYNYPSDFDMSDVNARLESSLNGAVQNTDGATIVNSEYMQLDGRTAIRAKYTVTQSGETFDMYYLATLLGNTMYALLGSCEEADFNIFINSFQVT